MVADTYFWIEKENVVVSGFGVLGDSPLPLSSYISWPLQSDSINFI